MTAGELTHDTDTQSAEPHRHSAEPLTGEIVTPAGPHSPVAPAHAAEDHPSHNQLSQDHTSHGQPTDNPEVIFGPLSTRGLLRLDEAMRLADASTGLTFSVYIGELQEPTREDAEGMLSQLAHSHDCVLIAVSPNQRLLEIVTGSEARKRILDRDCKLAAMSMAAAFTGGDLSGGLVAGLAQLAEHAGRHK